MKQFRNTPYYVTECGKIFRDGKRISTHYNRGGYEYFSTSINNIQKKRAVHRLVAELYCESKKGCSVVHHKDGNTKNNHFSNLEWITQKDNVHKQNDVGVRNFVNVNLYVDNVCVGTFKSRLEACRYASKEFDVSYSSLAKYGKTKDVRIEKV